MQLQGSETATIMKEVQAKSVFIRLESGASHEGEGWKAVTSGAQMAPAPTADLQLFDMQMSSPT